MFFLFLKAQFLSKQIIPESVIKQKFKISNKTNADVFISSTKPVSNKFCTLEAEIQPIKIYKRNKSTAKFQNTSKAVILGDLKNQRKLFNFLKENNFSPQFFISDETTHILTINDEKIPSDFVFERFLTEFNKIDVFIYGNSYRKICVNNKTKINAFCKVLTCLFVVEFLFRNYYTQKRIPFSEKKLANIWFVTKTGKNLTKHPKLNKKMKKIISELLIKSSTTKNIESALYDQFYSLKITRIFHLHVIPVCNNIFCVLTWREDFAEDAAPPEHILENGYLRLDDVEGIVPVKIKVSPTEDGKSVKLSIPLKIDNEECELTLVPYGTELPFGLYSLHETYTSLIHENIFNQGTVLELSKDSFINYLESIFYYLDYTLLIVYTQNGQSIDPIASFANDGDSLRIADQWAKEKYKQRKSEVLFKETVDKLRVCMSLYTINDHEYLLCVGYNAGDLIMRSAETRFHFIIAMFTAFSHTVLEKQNNITALPRVYDLITNSKKLTLIECVGSPSSIKSTCGTLFGRTPTEEMLHQILAPTVWSKTTKEEFKIVKQHLFYIALDNGVRIISITTNTFYDDLLKDDIYQYLIEDISNFKTIIKEIDFSKKIPPDLFNSMLGLHEVNRSSMKIIDPERLRKEIGLDEKFELLSQITTPLEFATFEKELNSTNKCCRVINILDKSMKPIRYGVVDNSAPIFYIYKLPDVSAIIKSETEQLKPWEKSSTYSLFIYNTEKDFLSNAFNEGMLLDDFAATFIFDPDQAKFIEHLRNPGTRGDIAQIAIRVFDGDNGFSWRLMKITPHKSLSEIFFVHIWALAKSSVAISRDIDFADIANDAFDSAKLFHWIFEDSKEPLRIFRSMPRGINTLIINWATIENNIHIEFKECVAEASRSCLRNGTPIDLVVPVYLDEVHWFLIRGSLNKGQLSGIAFDMKNISSPMKLDRLTEVIHSLENFVETIGYAKKYVDNSYDRNLVSTAELLL